MTDQAEWWGFDNSEIPGINDFGGECKLSVNWKTGGDAGEGKWQKHLLVEAPNEPLKEDAECDAEQQVRTRCPQ